MMERETFNVKKVFFFTYGLAHIMLIETNTSFIHRQSIHCVKANKLV